MSPRILATLAAAAFLSSSAHAQRLVQLPTSDVSSPQAAIHTVSPLVREKLVNVGIDAIGLYQRNDASASAVTYWLVTRAGTEGIRIFDSQFVSKKTFTFGAAPGGAAMSPDGRTFIATMGNSLRIFDALAETELQLGTFIDFGPTAVDAVITHNSKKAYIFSVTAQKVTAVDLTTRTIAGTLAAPGANSGALTLGNNGMVYLTYENQIVEIDPSVPLDTTAVRKRITLSGKLGRLQTTPDGTRGLVANTQPNNAQSLLYYINLADGTAVTLDSTSVPAELTGGPTFEQLAIAGNNLAFGIAGTTPNKRLYKITLPDASAVTGALSSPTFVTQTNDATSDAFFGSKGHLETANYLTVSGEYPVSQHLYVSSQLSRLPNSLAPDSIFDIDVPHNVAINPLGLSVPFSVGIAAYTRPPLTSNSTTPTSILTLGSYQPAVPLNGRSRPMGVRVLDQNGLPIAGANVTFLSTLNGVTFEGADATGNLLTNLDGYAFVTAVGPATSGVAQITASTPGVGTTSSFSLTVGAPDNGGGNGGGGNGIAGISIVSGDGQASPEGQPGGQPNPIVVRVADAQGQPLAGVPVTWTVTGQARLLQGFAAESDQKTGVTVTDSQGLASNRIFADRQLGAVGFTPLSVEASTVSAGAVTFHSISYPDVNSDSSPAPRPGAIVTVPDPSGPKVITGKVGQTIADAIQVQFTASGAALGRAIPNVAIELLPDNPSGPTASCAPDAAALSNIGGLASCSIKLGNVVGTGSFHALLGGGTLGSVAFDLVVQPGVATQISKTSGDNQSGLPGATLPNQLTVRVADAQNTPLSGQVITWAVTSGTATLLSNQSTTNNAGLATVGVILGSSAGQVQIKAQLQGNSNLSATFVANVTAVIASMTITRGNNQSTVASTAFGEPLVVELRDSQNNPVQGASVQFTVPSGSGSVSLVGNSTVTTGSNGQAAINVQATGTPGTATVRATNGNRTQDFTLTVRPIEIFNLTDIRNVATNAPGSNPTTSQSNPGGLAPGGLYRIYARGVGAGLNGVKTANLLLGPLPRRMNGITVRIGTTYVPIFQLENINGVEAVVVQAPFELTGGATDTVTIFNENNGSTNAVNNVPIVPVQPGIFETLDTDNKRFLVAQHLDGRYVTIQDPAKLGESIRVYFTGGGKNLATIPNSGDAGPARNYTGDIIAGVNGSGARVVSAEYAQGMVGVYDVIVQMPSVINPGDNPNTLQTGPDRPFALGLRATGSQNYVIVGSTIPLGQ